MCLQNYHQLDTKILIETLLSKLQGQEQTIERLLARITVLEAELAVYKNKKNSNNSHTPPSKDENRPLKNQSLREKAGGSQADNRGIKVKRWNVAQQLIPLLTIYRNIATAAVKI